MQWINLPSLSSASFCVRVCLCIQVCHIWQLPNFRASGAIFGPRSSMSYRYFHDLRIHSTRQHKIQCSCIVYKYWLPKISDSKFSIINRFICKCISEIWAFTPLSSSNTWANPLVGDHLLDESLENLRVVVDVAVPKLSEIATRLGSRSASGVVSALEKQVAVAFVILCWRHKTIMKKTREYTHRWEFWEYFRIFVFAFFRNIILIKRFF